LHSRTVLPVDNYQRQRQLWASTTILHYRISFSFTFFGYRSDNTFCIYSFKDIFFAYVSLQSWMPRLVILVVARVIVAYSCTCACAGTKYVVQSGSLTSWSAYIYRCITYAREEEDVFQRIFSPWCIYSVLVLTTIVHTWRSPQTLKMRAELCLARGKDKRAWWDCLVRQVVV
jgi:hypothetical protein